MLPKVTVVIPVYNEEEMLPLCLDSLVNLDYPKELLEIIAVDNGSTDSSASIIRRYPVKYISEKTKGAAPAKNAGVRMACGEITVFADADCVVDKYWLRNMAKRFEKKNVGYCSGKTLVYDPRTWIQRAIELETEEKYTRRNERDNILEEYFMGNNAVETCNAAFRTDAIVKAGLFDEELAYGDDNEMAWRINLEGYQGDFAPDAIVYHKKPGNLKEYANVKFKYVYFGCLLAERYKKHLLKNKDTSSEILSAASLIAWFVKQIAVQGFISIREVARNRRLVMTYLGTLRIIDILITFPAVICSKFGKAKCEKRALTAVQTVLWKWDVYGDILVINLAKGCMYRLSETACRVWELYCRGDSESAIASTIRQEYGGDESTVKLDVDETIRRFEIEGLDICKKPS